MTTVHCRCRVADFDAFRPGYDKALEAFGEHIRTWRLWRGQDDPNLIVGEEVFESRQVAETEGGPRRAPPLASSERKRAS